jgi:pyridoxine kinase
VWPVNTVEFSNHTGYGAWRGRVLGADLVDEIVQGMEERGVLGGCEALLSGYMGDAAVGRAVLNALSRLRAHVPGVLYCCDPVMGDLGRGIYVRGDIPAMFQQEVAPQAAIITPNQFELELLTGIETQTLTGLFKALAKLHALGPGVILVTSYRGELPDSMREGPLGMIASGGGAVFGASTPEFPFPGIIAGSGDLTTATFLSHYMEGMGVQRALEQTTASVFGIMKASFEAGSPEILLVEAQEELVNPARLFNAQKLTDL